MAALQGKKAALVPEVPQGPFAWHRLKHFVEQQGVRPAQRANNEAPSYQRPSFALMLWSNYAPDMGGVVGAARRTAVVHQDAQYGPRHNDEDGVFLDIPGQRQAQRADHCRRVSSGHAVDRHRALLTYSTSIPKPNEVLKQSVAAAPDPLREWAANHLEPVAGTRHASTCSSVKKAAAGVLGLGERSAQLQVQMRAAGFTLHCVCSGGRKRVCRYVFAPGEEARFVKLLDEDAAA